jgi:hypothetical protein
MAGLGNGAQYGALGLRAPSALADAACVVLSSRVLELQKFWNIVIKPPPTSRRSMS